MVSGTPAGQQVSAIAEELLKTEYDAVRIIYNRFYSAISFKPTIATVLRCACIRGPAASRRLLCPLQHSLVDARPCRCPQGTPTEKVHPCQHWLGLSGAFGP